MNRIKLMIPLGIFLVASVVFHFNSLERESKRNVSRSLNQGAREGSSPSIPRGYNLFTHEINSGNCASHGLQSITNSDVCIYAATSHGFDFQTFQENSSVESWDRLEGCHVRSSEESSFIFPDFLSTHKYDLALNNDYDGQCSPLNTDFQCSPYTPCFCMTHNYVERNKENIPQRRNAKVDGQFVVTWSLSLAGKESLLDSPFLRAAFAQSVKDYINTDIRCSDDLSVKGAEFFGVEIVGGNDGSGRKLKAVSGNGKCKGDISKCKPPVKAKKKKKNNNDDDDAIRRMLMDTDDDETGSGSGKVKRFLNHEESCEIFLEKSIFDAFKDKLLAAAAFNYDVDVDVLKDLEGSLNLDYDVSFEPSDSDGLDQVEEVDMNATEPVPIAPVCSSSQCNTQKETLETIFRHFGLPYNETIHECMYAGINCNDEDIITHIWLADHDLTGQPIPSVFGDLPSLRGLFLGNTGVKGTIPRELGRIRKLEMLWLDGNELTGTIPPQIGNLRALLELNLHDNNLSGSIPDMGKLQKLSMLNLGNNNLSGEFPKLFKVAATTSPPPVDPLDCMFPNVLGLPVKLGLKWLGQKYDTDLEPLTKLRSLVLNGNDFSGSIPTSLGLLTGIEELNLAENSFTGTFPSEINRLRNLNVFDLHDNNFSGSIPNELGEVALLKILNIYGNNFEGALPSGLSRNLRLEQLILDDNFLTGSIPAFLGGLRKLTSLTFSGNEMGGAIPDELGNLGASVKNLDLRGYGAGSDESGKRMTATIPSSLAKLTNWKHIVFENNGMTGTIPTEFGNLVGAEMLWLSDLKLSGGIPEEISNMESLSLLILQNISLTGTIPTALGDLENVMTMSFGNNALSGTLPDVIGNIEGLEMFSTVNNTIAGKIPTMYGNLTFLNFLNIANNSLTGSIPKEFGNLTALEDLYAHQNSLGGSLPIELGNMTAIRTIILAENTLSGSLPSELGKLDTLMHLDFAMNSFSNEIPAEFGNLTALVNFTGADNSFTGNLPEELGNLTAIEHLDLSGNAFTGPIPTELAKLTTLKTMHLGNNQFTGDIPSELGLMTALMCIEAPNNTLTGPIPEEIGNLTMLETLGVASNSINGTLPSELASAVTLVTLDLENNLLTGSVPAEYNNLIDLKHFYIGGNDITGALWFMCDLYTWTMDNKTGVDCRDYCGTVDEECNSTTVNDATCSDVGCLGSGVSAAPNCTQFCRLDYSTCLASSNETTVQLDISTDSKGYETNWTITKQINDTFSMTVLQLEETYRNDATNLEFYCIEEEACYTFELTDIGGDGICCGIDNDDAGSYIFQVNGMSVTSNNTFGSSISYEFGTCE